MEPIKRIAIPLLHLAIIVAAYSSPFYIPWQIIVLVIGLYYLQLLIFKGCILSIAQFGSSDERFVKHYFEKFTGISVKREMMDFILDRLIPILIVVVAIVYQVIIRRS